MLRAVADLDDMTLDALLSLTEKALLPTTDDEGNWIIVSSVTFTNKKSRRRRTRTRILPENTYRALGEQYCSSTSK
jgi:hypothetical protein